MKIRKNSEGGWKSFAGSSFQKVAGLFDFCRETFLIWKGKLVFARQNLVRQSLQGVLRDGVVLFCAKNKSNRRVLVRLSPMLARIVEIKMHLAGIGVRKLSHLQIDNDEAPQFAMEKKQIDSI